MNNIDINDIRHRTNLTWDELDAMFKCEYGTSESIGAGVRIMNDNQNMKLQALNELIHSEAYNKLPAELMHRKLLQTNDSNDDSMSDYMKIMKMR